ncbi:RagB/SusD family nutrient uptake outer membrane protein [Anditalea andensis]|uniref:Uncharacterized protein n=1 Tax=Anditalea andensis TaxID=1048983 RepID=A0A074KVM0_9BACT|nr:RagB/SusD family nutrient uptake outer membrane protein [Anditalea andensis]KEO71608.1 hypothetical protein EL17_23975 [Anditalea andensis]
MKKYTSLSILILAAGVMLGCEEFLDAKPNKGLSTAESIEELQALLDNVSIFNVTPGLDIVAADEYFTSNAGWISYGRNMVQQAYKRNLSNVFEDEVNPSEWIWPYRQVFYSNIVLDKARSLSGEGQVPNTGIDRVIGSAKFCRAFAFYNLAQNFAGYYYPGTTSIGIPLPLSPDVNHFPPFASLQETYDHIFGDLYEALELLPMVPRYKSQPSKAAAHALLARIYLSINDYERAENHADEVLKINEAMIDLNVLQGSGMYPIPVANEEVIYHAVTVSLIGFETNQETRVDTMLYQSYDIEDLRKTMYFIVRNNGAVNFRGSFSGNWNYFSGLTVGEVYLIRAECRSRRGDDVNALGDLNLLLRNRYKNSSFQDKGNVDDILGLILTERRKELIFRGLRWSDLKRGATDKAELTREVEGETFRFAVSPENFIFPVPLEEFSFR